MTVKGEPGGSTPDTGRYRILRHVASGGMGEVFLAESIGAHGVSKKVAIKRILPRRDGRGVPLFVEEARTAFALSHASIVQVFDFGVLGQDHVLVMEYVDGVDLARLLEGLPETRLPLDAALHVAIETLEGLEHAHGRVDDRGQPLHIVHCDIKPSNLLCSRDGEVKIADFGIARAAFQALDAPRQGAGTVGYMAPEQSSGGRVDSRTDVYGVGAVMVRALTGKTALPGEVPELPGTAPRALAPILQRALAVRAQDRYPSATAMLQDLEVLAQREGILASPRALAALVRQHLEARASGGGAKPRALDDLVRARARAIAGAAGTEPFSEGTNIVLAHVEGVTRVRIVMPEPLTLPEPPSPAATPTPSRPRIPLALTAAIALVLGLVVGAIALWPGDRTEGSRRARAPAGTPVAAPTAGAPAVEDAIVAVSTTPEDAALTLDGRPAGTAPAILEVPAGRHVIRAEAPRHRPAEREVKVAPGGRLTVQLALVAEESLPVVPPRAPAEPSGDARRAAPAFVPPPGFLNISSEPWARITIDGRATGLSTPARGIRLAPGPHVVELNNPVVGMRKRVTVRIESGRTATHRVPLR